MCNRYLNDLRKAGLELEVFGFEEWSETQIEVFPDREGLVFAKDREGRLAAQVMRWGFPPPPAQAAQRPVTNVRNLDSPYWRGWLDPRWRCLVPFTAFAEWSDERPKRERWFGLSSGRGGCFAGIWRPWTGVRGPKSAPVSGEHKLFAFLTCAPNRVVRPIHAKAMPVILEEAEAQRAWLEAPAAAVPVLAAPIADEALTVLDEAA